MNSILIIGNGKWGKKVLNFLKKKNYFNKIIVKTRKKKFEFLNYPNLLTLKKKGNILYNNYLYICTPLNTHFNILKKHLNYKKILIEKPLFRHKDNYKYFYKVFKEKKILVNYIDLYNPLLNKISFYKYKPIKIFINYSSIKNCFKNKKDFLIDWLDHPLSIILFFFKKFSIIKECFCRNIFVRNKKIQVLKIVYCINGIEIEININKKKRKVREIILVSKKNVNLKFDLLNQKILNNKFILFSEKNNSLDNFFNMKKNNSKNYKFQNIIFHEKIYDEKIKIIKKLKLN